MDANAVSAVGTSGYAATNATPSRRPASSAATTAASVPTDTYTPSSEASATTSSDASAKAKNAWAGFDMQKFENEMRDKLLQQIRDSQKTLKDAGVKFYGGADLLYEIPEADTESYTDEQMGVGKEWGAEATSDRLVAFAMGFRGTGNAKGLSDEDFVSKIRDAIKEGFRLAKGDLGDLPGPTGKLFNDTYKATMDKLDKALEDMKNASGSTSASTGSSPSSNSQTSSFDVLA